MISKLHCFVSTVLAHHFNVTDAHSVQQITSTLTQRSSRWLNTQAFVEFYG